MNRICSIFFVALLMSGCTLPIQGQLDQLGALWRMENQKLLEQMGTRYYKMDRLPAHRAMLVALTNLEMIVEQQDSQAGFILSRGNAPRPLSLEEWQRVEAVELPKIRAIMGFPVTFEPAGKEIVVNAFILDRGEDVQISLRFRKKQLGNTHGLMVTDQAPPEAVRIGLPKVWEEFEKVAFVQHKVLDSSPREQTAIPAEVPAQRREYLNQPLNNQQEADIRDHT